MTTVNMGNGQIDLVMNIGVGGERQFKTGFSIPAEMVKNAMEAGQLAALITMFASKEIEKITTMMTLPGKKHLTLIPGGKQEPATMPFLNKEQAVARNTYKLECLKSLISRGDYYSEIVNFLAKAESLPKPCFMALMNPDPLHKHIMLYDAIEQAASLKTLSMVHFSWTLLPKEKILLDLVATMDHKSFLYEEP